MTHRTLNCEIRWMIRVDMLQVLAIDQAAFEFPWGEDNFTRTLRQRDCIGLVAHRDGKVAGYAIYQLHKKRLHILNMAVAPLLQRRGAGRQILNKLKHKLTTGSSGRTRIHAEVRERNVDAQLFFRAMGFKVVSILKDFYDDTPEDAYLFEYHVGEQA